MKFKQALKKVKAQTRAKSRLDNPFYVFSCLSDLCSDSYEDKDKIKLFFEIDKRVFIIKTLREDETDGVDKLFAEYEEVSDFISENSYQKLVKTVAEVFYPYLEEKIKPQKQTNRTAKNKETTNPTVETQQEHEQSEARESSTVYYNAGNGMGGFIFGCVVAALIIAGFVTMIVLRDRIPWNVWQYIIGIGVGIILAVAWIITLCIIDDCYGDEGISSIVIYGIVTIINFTLAGVYKADYSIIYYCIFAIMIPMSIISICLSFDDLNEVSGFIQIGELVLNIIFTIIVVLVFN